MLQPEEKKDGGGGKGCDVYLLPQIHQKSIYTETTCRENLLNSDKRNQYSDRDKKKKNFTKLGRTKERKKKGENGETKQLGTHTHGRELEMEGEKKNLHALRSPPHQQGDRIRQRRNIGVLEENTATGVKQIKWKQSSTNGQCHCLPLPKYEQRWTEAGN